MTERIDDAKLARIGDFVAHQFGLHFPRERWRDLERGVCGAAQERGRGHDLERYLHELLSPGVTQNQLDVLVRHLTVGETYFFREQKSLEVFEKNIVPELIRTRAETGKAIRIWSAGCATGEEPYSVAIVLDKLMAGAEKWNVEILATDLNVKSLQKASDGVYGNWSFRGTPAWVRSAYFEAIKEDRWTIATAIKRMVNFAQINLVDDSLPGHSNFADRFDVIFCRNVLLYFTPEGIGNAVRLLYRSLASDGWLVVSPTEASHELFSEFARVDFGGVTLYRKSVPHAPKIVSLPSVVCDESQFSSPQLLEPRSSGRSELAATPVCDTSLQGENREADSENEAPPALSHGQALTLRDRECHQDAERVSGALPSQNGNSDDNDAQAMLLLARVCANQRRLAAALVWCDKAIAADKMAARAYYLRATILQEQGSLPEALLAFQQTVYAEPEFTLGHFGLGNLALRQGRRKDSEKHFENVLLLLARCGPDEIVPESEGLSASGLREMVALLTNQGDAAEQTGQPRIRVPQRAENLNRSSR